MNENLYTSTQQHVNDTSTIAKHCNTLWLNINKDRAHVNCRSSAIGIRSTFNIGNTSNMNHNVHVAISVGGECTNNVSSGSSCYMIVINNANRGTVGIVKTDDICQYGSINDVYNSSDNSYGHDMNDTHTKSGNNASDTTQQYNNSSSTIYQDGTRCNIHSNMIKDNVLKLRCDKSYYALRGLTFINQIILHN